LQRLHYRENHAAKTENASRQSVKRHSGGNRGGSTKLGMIQLPTDQRSW